MLTRTATILSTAAIATALLVVASPAAAHENHCKPVSGDLSSSAVAPPACDSVVGLCTAGELTGGLAGGFFFDGTTFVTENPTVPIYEYTGPDVLTPDAGGTINGESHGTIVGPDGAFVDLVTFDGGSGPFEGATGFILVQGHFDLANGTGSSHYSGLVCTPEHHHHH